VLFSAPVPAEGGFVANTDTFARENNAPSVAAKERGSMYTDKINPAKRTPGAAALCAAVLDRIRFFLPFGQNAKRTTGADTEIQSDHGWPQLSSGC